MRVARAGRPNRQPVRIPINLFQQARSGQPTLAFRPERAKRSRLSELGKALLSTQADPRSARQLHNPELAQDEWRASTLAGKLGIRQKLLKHWVTRGWAYACQRPIARTWIIWADVEELKRLQKLVASQAGQGSPLPPKELRTPRLQNRENAEQNA